MTSPINRRDLLRTGGVALGAGLAGAGRGPRVAWADDAPGLPIVRVLNSSGDLGIIIQSMTIEMGFAKQYGVQLDYQNVADGNKIIPGLLQGAADICTASGFSQVFPAIEKGAPLRIIGGCLSLPTLALFSAKPDVKSIFDLPGKVVAVGSPGSLLHMMTVAVLRKNKIDENKVQFVNVGSSGDTFRALTIGKVDAGYDTVDYIDEQAKYNLHVLEGGQMWSALPDFTMQAAYASEDAIKNKRDLLVRALATHGRLYRYLQGPDSWNVWTHAYAAYFGTNVDPVREKSFWNFIQTKHPLAVDLTLSEERFSSMQELNVSLGIQKKVLPYDQVADMSLAQEAVKMLA